MLLSFPNSKLKLRGAEESFSEDVHTFMPEVTAVPKPVSTPLSVPIGNIVDQTQNTIDGGNKGESGVIMSDTTNATEPLDSSSAALVPSSIGSKDNLTLSDSEVTPTPDSMNNLPLIPTDSEVTSSTDPDDMSNDANAAPTMDTRPTDCPTSKTTTASTCDCTTANTEATTSVSAADDDSKATSETPPDDDDDLFPSAPPGESEESVASISIFFMTVLLGQL